MFKEVELTYEQKEALEVARVGFMAAAPFYAHYFYSECKEVYTTDIPTAATDGRRVFINPNYFMGLKIPERVFVFAHEMEHIICRDVQRTATYGKAGDVDGTPFDSQQLNISQDYVINAGLLEEGIGMCNPSWCYASDVTGQDLKEEVYARKFKKQPDGQGGTTFGMSSKSSRGAARDKAAESNGGSFDQLLPPEVDPVTGKEDLPTESEFKEAVARAAAVAKAIGKLSDNMRKKVDEILEPQIDWAEHIRLILTGHMGARHETWNRLNRRRLVLNPIVAMPGRRGYGAELIVIGIDTSGSIYSSPKAIEAFFGEVGGIISDIRPKRIVMVEIDTEVKHVSESSSMDDLKIVQAEGVHGGGGTRFEPLFEYIAENNLNPDTAIYLTDLYGSFPREAPSYPVVWASIAKDQTAPFGETVYIDV